jgi:hypothetical protein
VPRDHHAFDDALRGVARPGRLNGHSDADRHNRRNDTRTSCMTSWTYAREVAVRYAGSDGVVLEWHTGAPPPGAAWSFEWSPDEFREQEILIRGVLRGAKATRP